MCVAAVLSVWPCVCLAGCPVPRGPHGRRADPAALPARGVQGRAHHPQHHPPLQSVHQVRWRVASCHTLSALQKISYIAHIWYHTVRIIFELPLNPHLFRTVKLNPLYIFSSHSFSSSFLRLLYLQLRFLFIIHFSIPFSQTYFSLFSALPVPLPGLWTAWAGRRATR